MKYDRPVWQIMHACADAMPEVLRYDDVRAWFAEHYPDVNEATIRAHLIGLTDGGRAKHVQFAQRSPVFRRVARGEYAAIPVAERGESPDGASPSASKVKMSGNGAHLEERRGLVPGRGADTPAAREGGGRQPGTASAGSGGGPDSLPDDEDPEPVIADVVLLGSVGRRVNVPAPAKEIFRDVAFQLGRRDAELAGGDWFVLSAEHGLLAPHEWISPDSRTLDDLDVDYRVVWAAWVVARLESLIGPVDGMTVRVDAPAPVVGPLFTHLQAAGAVVVSGQAAAVTDLPGLRRVPGALEPADEHAVEPPAQPPAALSPVTAHLLEPGGIVPATEVGAVPDRPGLYAWFVDADGARELNRSLRLPVRTGAVFVGQIGGSSWHSVADPALTLRDHLTRVTLGGHSRASTFRMTLATVLRERLAMTSPEDPRLTAWMLEHLSVSWWADGEPATLRALEQLLIDELEPVLNVDHQAGEYRTRLGQMRSALG